MLLSGSACTPLDISKQSKGNNYLQPILIGPHVLPFFKGNQFFKDNLTQITDSSISLKENA
jgi:hypothetical protein